MKLSTSLLAVSLLILTSTNCKSQILFRSNPLISNPGIGMVQPNLETRYPVIARGPDRAMIQNTPIELRPNRPFHFYGNTVRRTYYGQSLIPFVNR